MENLHWKSPFEMLYGYPPSIEELRVIGCLCYAAKLGEPDRFEARACKCVLLGYTFGFKVTNYMILTPDKSFTTGMRFFRRKFSLLRLKVLLQHLLFASLLLFGLILFSLVILTQFL